jgi:hypothetical protein
MKNRVEQRTVDLDVPMTADKAKLARLVVGALFNIAHFRKSPTPVPHFSTAERPLFLPPGTTTTPRRSKVSNIAH